MEFDWDEHNLFHIAMHGIDRADVEAALVGRTIFIKDELRRGEDRRTVVGKAANGRILLVVNASCWKDALRDSI